MEVLEANELETLYHDAAGFRVSVQDGSIAYSADDNLGYAKFYENGILMTGGGSLLRGLPELLTQETGIKTRVSENAIEAVSIGTAKAFEYTDLLQTGFSQEQANNY